VLDNIEFRAFELTDKSVVLVFLMTAGFPRKELYGVNSHIRRAAIYFSLQSST